MAQFRVRWPSSDGESWSSVEATDSRDAAERYAASVCSDDPACYEDFERGQDVEARFPGSPDILKYRVSCEFSPTFRAVRR